VASVKKDRVELRYEVWLDAETFIARFYYPPSKKNDVTPEVADGMYRLASHCHYIPGHLPEEPYAWLGHGLSSAQHVAGQVRRDFPGAYVSRFDGVTRREMRARHRP